MNLHELSTYSQKDIQLILDLKLEESLKLEFKNGLSLENTEHNKKEIAKDVSAFANSDGGIIIYGIDEKDHIASDLTFVDGRKIPKEWIENVIVDNIQQKIENLEVIPVRFNDKIEDTIYVIKIPKSDNSPHMSAKDKKYYRRYNFKSVAMEEYEIRNLYLAQRSGRVVVNQVSVDIDKKDFEENYNFIIKIIVLNEGNVLAEKYKVVCKILNANDMKFWTPLKNNITNFGDDDGVKISNSEMCAIFPNESINALEFNMIIKKRSFDNFFKNVNFEMYTFTGDLIIPADLDIKSLISEVKKDADDTIIDLL